MMDKLQKFCVISLTQGGRHADNTVDLQEFMIMPTGAENMEQAVKLMYENTSAGDIVSFSPASASFDLYRNFEERGRHFKRLVRQL